MTYTNSFQIAGTAQKAIGRWSGILQELGISPEFLSNRHGPCPVCGGKDRFRFDDKEGRGTWYCSHCGAGDGFRLLQLFFRWDFRHAANEVDRVISTAPRMPVVTQRTGIYHFRLMHETWNSAKPVTSGDPVWKYLNKRTGIEIVPADIRFHPALRYTGNDKKTFGVYPAMLALMRYPDGSVASVHRTYLTLQGTKALVAEPKKIMPGGPLKTASVQLNCAGRVLGIAEGIETALAASRRFSIPVWAAGNATLLKGWVPPAGVRQVLIAGDNDASYTGQAAAFDLARRLVSKGYETDIQIPRLTGTDWADDL
ncbi:DUF7146 domain-containing protein [Noviherbaspirillum galbum]|uniref:P4 alpha zinc-binding domain protein n=1 Tax=Noviherbaspirillum galbum TaxID=2709383 RepID=A0A6B3SPP6_9BURK|nr:primase-helicase zinc-binding domain-containing protein [Noviherbaspirillum galbum]NEX62468.1 P4 alpha zinc-binding domain protein [Noviherbaspirillum galbum]